MTASSTVPVNSARAAETGEIIRSTGERVETSFWSALNDLLFHIPNLIGFLFAIAIAWLIGRLIGKGLAGYLGRRDKEDLGHLLGKILAGLVVLVGGLFALIILFPRIDPTGILSLLGIGSIAIGFAFKDILQNLAAGVILLVREPYKKGDEVLLGDYEGVIEEVETRATHIRTIDRRLVIIPNVKIFMESIIVNTDSDFRMTAYSLSIAYGGEPRRAMEIVLDAIKSANGVLAEPEPRVAIEALNDYSIDLFITYPAGSAILDQITTKGAVLLAIHDACRANGIALPFPTHVNLVRPYGLEEYGPNKLDGVPSAAD